MNTALTAIPSGVQTTGYVTFEIRIHFCCYDLGENSCKLLEKYMRFQMLTAASYKYKSLLGGSGLQSGRN
jgi:hypothetical protein